MEEGGNRGIRLASCALAFLLGCALQLQQVALWSTALYGAALVLALVAALFAWRVHWAGEVVAAAALAFGATGLHAQARLADALAPELEGVDLDLTGIVAQLPRRGANGVSFAFEVERAERGGQPVRVPRRVRLGWYGGLQDEALLHMPYESLAAGQRWRLPVRLQRPHGSANPHGFDHELWLFEQDLRASGAVRATERTPAQLLGRGAGAPVERARQWVRDAIERRVPDARAAGVLAALSVGDQAAIDRDDWDVFRTTGIAHLVAISGLHVTMFAWLASALIGRLWRSSERAMLWQPAPVAARWGGLLAAAGYALLAGWGVPAQRTVWMLATAALLWSLGLRWPWTLVLLVVAVVVAAIDPWALLQPGFWLSFAAVGLLFVAAPPEPDVRHTDRRAAFAALLRQALRTQVVATVGLAPLSLLFFHQLSLVGFVANLFAIPWVTLLVTPLALLGAVLPPLWTLGAACVRVLSGALESLAGWPAALWTAAASPWWMGAAGLAGAAVLVMPLPWRVRALGLALMLPLFAPPVERPPEGQVQLVVADVGQGSAILVRTHRHALLHDAGPQYAADSEAGTRVLLPLLRGLGVQRVDLLMLSHRDSDHVGGAAALLAGLPVAAISSSLEPEHALLAGRAHTRCEAGQSWQWDGVRFEVLHPRAEDHARRDARPNTLSCVLSITDAAGRRVLLTGDLEAEQEARLVRDAAASLRSQVLLVPHHGSRTSSTPAFLDAVAPRHAPVQAGWRNRFGHPAPDVLARYRERGITVLRTDRCGAWLWRSDADSGICWRDAARRYWHHPGEGADGAELASAGRRP